MTLDSVITQQSETCDSTVTSCAEEKYFSQQCEENEATEFSNDSQQADDFKTNFYNPFEVKHRRRTSRAQFKVLEKTFLENPKPSAPMRRWLAQKLVMSPRGVQVWFQNRRAKEKNSNAKAAKQLSTKPPPLTDEQDSFIKDKPVARDSSTQSMTPYPIQNLASPLLSSSPLLSPCACSDCSHSNTSASLFSTTPMSRTLSYPSFYHSDASSTIMTAEEEDNSLLLMMPFDSDSHDKPQCMYEYPSIANIMNQRKMIFQSTRYNQPTSPALWSLNEDEATAFLDNRRYSYPAIITPNDKLGQSTELFRRLSEPIFTTYPNLNFDIPFSYLSTRPNTAYSPI
ncbi:MAG: hypothetical protein EXX96DRAFT_611900 [Benjaminiella poitrasii]|nr:MAG: hypothetical protein EXX96DRAFT_654976 [Benjaminiella poitrasii]KAI9470735.1 MAG: hypothetical protein EXX96DRAFT_611900 [Benjaminiella poitrasii]